MYLQNARIDNYQQISERISFLHVKLIKYWKFERNQAKNPLSGTSAITAWAREQVETPFKRHVNM